MTNAKPPSVQTGMRIPVDLAARMDALCAANGLTRTAIIVAALRAHLGVRAPAETIGMEKPQ